MTDQPGEGQKPLKEMGLAKADEPGWVMARVPANREFTVHEAVSRPLLRYDRTGDDLVPIYGTGPACFCPVEIRLTQKNQFTRLKREERTERPFPLYKSYLFIQDPSVSLIADLRIRSLCYGLIPGVPLASNNYSPGPLRLSQRAVDLMRNKYGAEYDPKTGAGHRTTKRPEAHMPPGHEYAAGDYVHADDPAWQGHRLMCLDVLDTTARVLCSMFGIDHEVEVPLSSLRKAG